MYFIFYSMVIILQVEESGILGITQEEVIKEEQLCISY